MSTETPETKNPYQLRREAICRAIEAWQQEDGSDTGHELADADALDACLNDAGLTLMPRSTGHGAWRVLVDGQPAPYLGQDEPSHPMGAEEAAEAFLTQSGGDYYNQKAIVVRPASDREMVTSAVIGDTTVHEEPTRIAPTVFMVEVEENVGATLVRMIDKDGREVMVGLDDAMRDLLVSMLDSEDGSA